MAENLRIPGRLAVRTPMQWTAADNGGFSKAQKRRLTRPLPDGLYGPERVNAADQRHDHQSFLLVHTQSHLHVPAAAGDRLVDGRGLGAAQPGGLGPRMPREVGVGDGSRCTTSVQTAPSCRFSCRAFRRAAPSSTCLTDSPSTNWIPRAGIDVDLDGYGYRWLRLRRPEDEPII